MTTNGLQNGNQMAPYMYKRPVQGKKTIPPMIDSYDGTRIATGKSYKDYIKEAHRMEPKNYPHNTSKKK